jgi:hypothetical protein
MRIAHEIAFLVFPIWLSYALRLHAISSRVGRLLAEGRPGQDPSMLERLITPKTQIFAIFIAVSLGSFLLGAGMLLYPWYTALGVFLASLLLTLLMNYFIPGEKTPHYLAVIRKGLNKKMAGVPADDPEQLQALEDIAVQLELMSRRKGLFDEKSLSY